MTEQELSITRGIAVRDLCWDRDVDVRVRVIGKGKGSGFLQGWTVAMFLKGLASIRGPIR